jgi:hypothetical protein
MKTIALSIIAAVFAGSAAAETYTLPYIGTSRHTIDAWECGEFPGYCHTIAPGVVLTDPYYSVWTATLTLTTPGDGGGTFSDMSGATLRMDDPARSVDGLLFGSFSAVVDSSGVESIIGTMRIATFTEQTYVFDGVNITADTPAVHHSGETYSVGAVGAVPEPSTWAMLLAGIAWGGRALRRRRAPK